jgi:hypothetical protein
VGGPEGRISSQEDHIVGALREVVDRQA